MKHKKLILSLIQLKEFCLEMASNLKPSTVLLLEGPVGSGKTQFTKFLVEALTGHLEAHSPSYSLINEYKGAKFPIFHMDLYRLKNLKDLDSTGFWDLFDLDGIVLVEWSDLLNKSAFPKHWKIITLEFNHNSSDMNSRTIQIKEN